MKKIFLFLFVLASFYASAQPGYTTINARYSWLAGKFSALHLPGFNTTPSLQSGQWPGDGAVGIDTAANIMYFYSGGTWRAVGTGTVGGSTTQVQYNNAGAFGGISGATTNGTVLTLTSPVINVTSDATGDVYYRSSGGAFTRLPIGTTGQQLTVSGGGLPSWAASGGTTPTLQQVLTAGSTLTGSNTIDVGSLNTFIINNGLSIQMQTTFGTEIADLILQANETTLTTSDGSSTARGAIIMHPTGDVGLIATDGATYTDSIMLLNHDGIIKVDSLKIRDASLGAASVGYVLTLDNVTTGATKWSAGGGGGWGTTGTIATLTGASTLDLDGNAIVFSSGGNNFLTVDPTPGSELVYLNATNATGGGNFGQLTVDASATVGEWEIAGSFNAGAKESKINGVADATTSTLTYTADTHTFTVGANNYLVLDDGGLSAIMRATDGTAQALLVLDADSPYSFSLLAEDGVNPSVTIDGNGASQAISITAANGVYISHISGNTGLPIPTLAAGAGAGTTPTLTLGSGSTDIGGFITVLTGTLPSLGSIVVTLTFGAAYGSSPKSIILTPANTAAAALSGVTMVYVDQAGVTTTTFDITSGATALAGATTYKWFYQVVE